MITKRSTEMQSLLIASMSISCFLMLHMLTFRVAMAVELPIDGRPMTAREQAAYRQFQEEFRPTGIARRIQQIKHDKLEAIAAGLPAQRSIITFNMPVIMGSYADNAHIFDSSDFQDLIFGSHPGGSVADYYSEISYGEFQLTGQVYGPYTADSSQAYYTAGGGYPTNAGGWIHSILSKADPDIDFSQYDNDGPDGVPNSGDDDGVVDVVMFIFPDASSSYGDADNFGAQFQYMFWRGAPEFVTNDSKFGGGTVIVDENFQVGAERRDGSFDELNGIGQIAHEFGHVLGLPDQYDGDGTSRGVGTWCLMSTGSAGACECWSGTDLPTHMCAWCKTALGFLLPIDVVGTQAVTIPSVETNPVVYRLWEDPYQGERYFLLENRTKTGFDADNLGEGLLIWHCNGDAQWDNTDDSFRILDLEEADGLDDLDG